MKQESRTCRLRVDLSNDEIRAVHDFWFRERLSNKSAAFRELLRRGIRKAEDESQGSPK